MTRFVIDTDVLIDHQKGIAAAREYLKKINLSENELFLSVITVAELYAGLSGEERKRSEPLLSAFEIIVFDRPIAEMAAQFLYDFQKRYGLGLGDAVIAATTSQLRARLVTRNRKHFPMSEIQISTPY